MRIVSLKILNSLSAIIIAFILGGLFIWITGKGPLEIYVKLFSDTLGNSYGIGQVLFKATPLIFTGLSVAFAFRGGLFNIGAEGQLYIGSLLIGISGVIFGNLHPLLLIPLCLVAGFIGGAIWGFIPGFLKWRFGSHEVINTIMLNFIALALVSYIVNNVFLVPASVHTPEISVNAYLMRIDYLIPGFKGSPMNLSLIIAIVTAFIIYLFFKYTPLGYEITTMGKNESVAWYTKMNIKKLTILSMTIAGGIAGLSGSNFVMGYKHYFELGFSEGAGYLGIAIALMARNNPISIILVSIFFGILEYGGLTINTLIPKEIMTILQAIIILTVIILTKVFDKLIIKFQS
jgi:general nucleoside transport system permease protein